MNSDPPPVVSVITGVYNPGEYLRASAASILAQDGIPWEWIVIDDGSTDGASQYLADLARNDLRVRVFHQSNQGLTKSLIRGCSQARGRFIARHDADDLSLPGRLVRQAELLDADNRIAFVSCRSLLIGPRDELLLETNPPHDCESATRQLRSHTNGPYHGSVMFRNEAYQRVGGYRPEFRYAQDWDLWLRLVEVGAFQFAPEVLYAFRVSGQSISSFRREQQLRLANIALQCVAARNRGASEEEFRQLAAEVSALPAVRSKTGVSANNYFIGKCLLDRRDSRALSYLWKSVRNTPWRYRPWLALIAAFLCCRSRQA